MKWFVFPMLLLFSCTYSGKRNDIPGMDTFSDSAQLAHDRVHADSLYKEYSDNSPWQQSLDSIRFFDARLIENETGIQLTYKKDNAWKNVQLDTESVPSQKDVSIDTIQLNGKGNPELLLHVEQWSQHSYYPNPGGWAYDYSDWYVYDVDGDTLLFHAEDTNIGGGYGNEEDSIDAVNSSSAYRVHFSQNQILIDSLTTGNNTKPDHKTGVYVFSNGKFVRKQN